jgi:hypothetical protein
VSLFCDDGSPAEITPHVPVPPLAKGETRPRILEPERDRCQRPTCRKVAWQHWTVRP